MKSSLPNQLLSDSIAYLKRHPCQQDTFEDIFRVLRETSGKRVVVGLGKSSHPAQYLCSGLHALGYPALFLHAAEALHGDLGALKPEDVLIIFSHSGASPETLAVARYAHAAEIPVIAVTAHHQAPLTRYSQQSLHYEAGEWGEWGTLPTLSVWMMTWISAVILANLQAWADARTYLNAHPGGSIGRSLRPIADLVTPKEHSAYLQAEASLREALTKMNQHAKGCTIVTDVNHDHILGIFTDGDLRRSFLLGAQLSDPISQWMTINPKCAQWEMQAGEIKTLMTQHKITALPVLKNGLFMGLIEGHKIDAFLEGLTE